MTPLGLDPNWIRLLQQIAQLVQLPDLTPDAMGGCALRFDDGPTVTLQVNPNDGEEVWLMADLGIPPPSIELYEHLLRANLLWRTTFGATLSLADGPEGSKHVIVARSLRWRAMDITQMVACLETFVDTAQDWSDLLAEPQEESYGTEVVHEAAESSSRL